MGFFSWKTSDTKRSIPSSYSCRSTFTVHMITEDGQVFTENDYEGYGVFGGKDIYELIADLNGLCPEGDTDDKRSAAIDLLFKTIITCGERSYTQGVDFQSWEQPLEAEGGRTANELVRMGWKQVYPNGYGNFEAAAENGVKVPKLVERIPGNFNVVPYPENCEDQGYFYNDEVDDEDEEDEDYDGDDASTWPGANYEDEEE
jgi:hypothetical protein